MKKEICLNFPDGFDDTYKQWTKEAVNDFLGMFSEYGSLFEIKEGAAAQDLSSATFNEHQLTELVNGAAQISQQNGQNPRTANQMRSHFTKQPDGTYKFNPADSLASQTQIDRTYLWLQKHKSENPGYSFPIEINFSTQANSSSYGHGGMMDGICLFIKEFEKTVTTPEFRGSLTDQALKQKKLAFFKTLLQHELGHAFQAATTRSQRQGGLDTSSSGLPHCNGADCLMQNGANAIQAFERLYAENKEFTFCSDCKADIGRFMECIKTGRSIASAELNNNPEGDARRTRGYEEGEDVGPELVRNIKKFCKNMDIPYRATAENQREYPFSYNLYEKGADPATAAPTGQMNVRSDNHVSLKSENLNHFVAMMRGLKESGMTTVNLNLNRGSEEDKKKFAANAIIAATITGMEIPQLPYPLDQLRNYGPQGMMDKIIKIREQQQLVRDAAQKVEACSDDSQNEPLTQAVQNVYASYEAIATQYLPDKDHLRIFACGVDAINKAKTRKVINQVLAAKQKAGNGGA